MPLTSSGQISCSVLPFDTTTTLTSAAPTSTPAHISLDCCLGWLMILWFRDLQNCSWRWLIACRYIQQVLV